LRILAAKTIFEKLTQSDGWSAKLADMDGDGLDEILLLSDRVQILKLQ